ncbi:MAG TPA: hypothetical protein VEU30_12810 [Thermoanaerobaculia bacterium]|nr:hypothetical protein [Thermoanaerobaculia bacterium]
MKATTIPRILATIVLLGSLAMLVPLTSSVGGLLRGEEVASSAWVIPIVILATGFALISFLPRMTTFGSQLYLAALALWIVAAGYYFFNR